MVLIFTKWHLNRSINISLCFVSEWRSFLRARHHRLWSRRNQAGTWSPSSHTHTHTHVRVCTHTYTHRVWGRGHLALYSIAALWPNSPPTRSGARLLSVLRSCLFFIAWGSSGMQERTMCFDVTFSFGGFPGGSAGKASACNAGDLGSIPGLGRPPGEGKGYPLP